MYAASLFHQQVQDGAVAEIDRIWRAQYPALMARARRYAKGREDVAETLVSQTALRVLGHVRRGQLPVSNMESLFFVSLKNTATDYWRAQVRRARTFQSMPEGGDSMRLFDRALPGFSDALDAPAQLVANEEITRAMGAARKLAAHLRELFDLHVVEGRSYREIAETLEISEALARKRMQLARRALRQALDQIDQPEIRTRPVHNRKVGTSLPFDNQKCARG